MAKRIILKKKKLTKIEKITEIIKTPIVFDLEEFRTNFERLYIRDQALILVLIFIGTIYLISFI